MDIICNYQILGFIILPVVLNIFAWCFFKKSNRLSNLIHFAISLIPIVAIAGSVIYNDNNMNKLSNIIILFTRYNLPHINLFLKTSLLSNAFVTLIGVMYPLATLYSIGYFGYNIERVSKKTFHLLVSMAVMVTIFLAYSANLLTAFISYEILSLATYSLVISDKTEKTRKYGIFYLAMLLIPSVLMLLPAIVVVYNTFGTTDFIEQGIMNKMPPISNYTINILFGLFFFGIAKTAILPFSSWLTYAMVAPAPVSGLLHAVLVVKSGIFLLTRVTFEIFGGNVIQQEIIRIYGIPWPIYLVCLTILFGSISAVLTNNIKKRLAYSTISQLSYIMLTILYASHTSIRSGILLFVSHALAKLILFFYVGMLYVKSGIKFIDDFSHKNNQCNRIIIFCSAIAIFSLIGMPPTSGFVSKYQLILSILNHKEDLMIFVVILLSTLIAISYLMPILYYGLFRKKTTIKSDLNANDICMIIPIIFLAITLILLFIYIEYVVAIDDVYLLKNIIKI